jgi:endonuclease/exonuclease/phosphatase (EEP) superfamily protein YafD
MLMPNRWVVTGCWLYAVLVAAIAVTTAIGPERWWWAGVNMFLPQILWAGPAVVIVPLALWRARRWTWLPAAAALWVAGPLMGFCWNATRAAPPGTSLRVMTYNVQLWQRANVPAIISEIRNAAPDILCLQDARGAARGQAGAFLKGWHLASAGQYVIASTFPFVDSAVGDISYRGHAHSYLRARVDVGGQVVTVVNAHFVTPRDALTVMRTDRFWTAGAEIITRNLSDRITQARGLAEDVRHIEGPLIVAGDLNAPPPSLASLALVNAGLVDAFAESGRGYGYTFGHSLSVGQSFLRLDRILASRHLFLVRTTVGSADGADHRPVIADMVLPAGPP